MSIASRIDSIEQHLKESYQELKGLGIDTTGVNNNLENIPKLIDGYWQTLPKVTGEGTSITLDNTKEGKMGIIYKGNTYQYSTTGVNLFTGKSSYSKTIHNVEFTINDSKVTINGQNDYSGQINSTEKDFITPYQVEPNTVYTYKVFVLSGSFTGTRFAMNLRSGSTGTSTSVQFNVGSSLELASGTNSATFTSSSNSNYLTGLQFIFSADAKFTNLVLGVELVKGNTEPTTYEPYTNGASPNPDYPQEIQVVSGDNTIKVEGKNLISSYTKNAGNQIYFNGVSDYSNNFIFKPGTYTFSYINNGSNSIFTFIKEKGDASSTNKGGGNPITFTTTKEFNIWLYRNGMQESEVSQPQLEKGSQATTYEPYKGATYPINLPEGMELCKIGEYQDRIVKDNGKWYVNKQICKVVLDGSESWSYGTSSGYPRCTINSLIDLMAYTDTKRHVGRFVSSHFTPNTTDNTGHMYQYQRTILCNPASNITSLNDFKTWLASNNVTLYYVLATPTNTEIEGTLKEQLEAIKTSYENQTNISQENNDLASVLNASALRGETETPNLQRLALEPNDELRDEEPIEEEVIEEEPTEEIENDDMR